MKKPIFLLLLTTCVQIYVSAQSVYRPGYVVTLENDTITGEVKHYSKGNYLSCLFKKNGQVVEYGTNQIFGFGFNNYKSYSSKVIDTLFLEVLVEGEVSLFRDQHNFFIKKNYGKVYSLKEEKHTYTNGYSEWIWYDNIWKGILNYLLNDCLPISRFPDQKYNEKPLVKLVKDYNDCLGTGFKEYKAKLPYYSLNIGASIGMNHSWVASKAVVDQILVQGKLSSVTPTFGIILEHALPRINDNFKITTEAHYSRFDYTGTAFNQYDGFGAYHQITTSFSSISIPLVFSHTLNFRKIAPFIQTGAAIDLNFNGSSKISTEMRYNNGNLISSTENSYFKISKSQIGFLGGIGLTKSYSSFRTEISVRFNQMFLLNQHDFEKNHNNRLTLSTFVIID